MARIFAIPRSKTWRSRSTRRTPSCAAADGTAREYSWICGLRVLAGVRLLRAVRAAFGPLSAVHFSEDRGIRVGGAVPGLRASGSGGLRQAAVCAAFVSGGAGHDRHRMAP